MTALRPPHLPWVSPYIILRNIDATADFYVKAFGFKLKEKAPAPDGQTGHVEMFYQDQVVMFGRENAWQKDCGQSPIGSGVTSPVHLYVYCEDVDHFYQHAIKAGAKALQAPEDMFWGDRMCVLGDPEGYQWTFATHKHPCPGQKLSEI